MKRTPLLFLNTITFCIMMVFNFLASTGRLNGKTVGAISDLYPTLITPPGYAFSIWGVIYLSLTFLIAFQWYTFFKNQEDALLVKMGYLLSWSNLTNTCWILVWTNQFIFVSVIVILLLLMLLLRMVFRLNIACHDAPLRTLAFVWWPISIYVGWIVLATVVNTAATLVHAGWNGGGITPVAWTIICIAVSFCVYLSLIYFRNMREAAAVGVWGLFSIAQKQWHDHSGIAVTAAFASGLLFLAILFHAYRNRQYAPWAKLKRGEI